MQENIGIIGLGTVGLALYNQVKELSDFNIKKVAIKNTEKKRAIPPSLLTEDAFEIIDDPQIGIILEAIDDEVAGSAFARQTLKRGKVYISASKKMIANSLEELKKLERFYGGKIFYEASVGGAVPVLRTIKQHLGNEPIEKIRGIVNGSCNYILSSMEQKNQEFNVALEIAQDLGFAESDPSLDIDGWDSYYKSLILADTAFGDELNLTKVDWTGIRSITLKDVQEAKEANQKIKLIAEITQNEDGLSLTIAPEYIDAHDPLYNIDWETNAIAIYGKYSGVLTLQGPGAGGNPTAAAMVGDLFNAKEFRASQEIRLNASIH